MRRWRRAIGALVVSAVLTVVCTSGAGADPASDFMNLTNQLRASKGVPTLSGDGQLASIAAQWVQHMASQGTLSHNPNLASSVTENWTKLGENVGTGPTVDAIQNAFVHSPEHYRNLVDPAFQYIGVAAITDANGAIWVVVDFMQLAASSPPPTPPPAPAPPRAPPATPRPQPPASLPVPLPPRPTPTVTTTTTTTTTSPPPNLSSVVKGFGQLNPSS